MNGVESFMSSLDADNKVHKLMVHAATNYLVTTIKFFDISRHEFGPQVTRIVMEMHQVLDESGSIEVLWELYAELVAACKTEGLDITMVPLRAFGCSIH
tara:strand:+ start:393274 stop:393570 length:297 start_codon:yes stop_codon:yes gene_type:complete